MVLCAESIVTQLALTFESVGAGWVLWTLLGLSVVSIAVMIERAIYFSSHSIGEVGDIARLLQRGQLEDAAKAVESRRGLEAEVVRQGIEAAPLGPASVRMVVEKVIKEERLRYERFLSFLGTLGNNAPFLGLFGTVLGIISAFAELARSAKAGTMTAGGSGIMIGISEALVATAVGLIVALPAVALYNTFVRWMKTIAARGELLGDALQAHLESVPPESAPVVLPRAANGK